MLESVFCVDEFAEAAPEMSPEAIKALVQKTLPRLWQQQRTTTQRGWKLFLERDLTGTALGVKTRVDALGQSVDLNSYSDLCSDEDWAILLSLPFTAMKAGQLDEALAMYSVLQALSPGAPQPYIGNFTITWQKVGVKIAAHCYRLIQSFMQSPTFFYYAADCFQHANAMNEARESIQTAIDLLSDEAVANSIDPKVRGGIFILQKELQAAETPSWHRA